MTPEHTPKLTRQQLFENATSGPRFAQFLRDIDARGELETLTPEFALQRRMPHRADHHPEAPWVLGHTLAALECCTSTLPLGVIGVWVHDWAKGFPEWDQEHKRYTYRGHEDSGVGVIRAFNERTEIFTPDELRVLEFLIINHMHSRAIIRQEAPRPLVVRLRSSPPLEYSMLTDLWRADNACRGPTLWNEEAFELGLKWVEEVYSDWMAYYQESIQSLNRHEN